MNEPAAIALGAVGRTGAGQSLVAGGALSQFKGLTVAEPAAFSSASQAVVESFRSSWQAQLASMGGDLERPMEAEDGEKSAEKASAAEERPATGPETSIAQRSHAEAIALKPSAHSSSQTASGTNAAPTRGQSPPHRIVQSPPSRSSDQTVVAGPIGSTWKSAAAKPASTGPARRVAESAHDATAIPVVVGPTALNPTLPVAASQAASSMPPLPASSFEEVSRSRPVSKGPEFSSRVQSEWLEGAPSAAMPDAVAASIGGQEETAGGATQPQPATLPSASQEPVVQPGALAVSSSVSHSAVSPGGGADEQERAASPAAISVPDAGPLSEGSLPPETIPVRISADQAVKPAAASAPASPTSRNRAVDAGSGQLSPGRFIPGAPAPAPSEEGAQRPLRGSGTARPAAARTAGISVAMASGSADGSGQAHDPAAARVETVPQESTRGDAAATDAREVFAELDRGTAPGAPTWIHGGARQAEAGFQDPSLGWVGVRAEMTGGGVHATLVPDSSAAAGELGKQMEGLHTYLAEQRAPVTSLGMAAPPDRGAGALGGGDAGQQMQQGTDQQGQQQDFSGTNNGLAQHGSGESGFVAAENSAAAAGLERPAQMSGGHISVVA